MPKENSTDKLKDRGGLVKSPNHFPVVGIGASAGGLDAFKKLLKAIPENSGMAYVLVQHLHPSHASMLPDILQKVTKIPVLEISDDIKVIPDHIYIIPSNKMLVAKDGVLKLSARSAKKEDRALPVDLFFSSLAEVHQAHSIGVVLSGTASDGTLGLKAIKEHGGLTFAQEEASAAYDGMPHSAIEAGVVDFILPPEKIPAKIIELTKITHGNGAGDEEVAIPQQEEDVFKQILLLLRLRKGIDFTYYKQTTIRRRILRRMALGKMAEPATYLTHLRKNKPEQDVLFQDLLIPVTSFFRDPKSFDNICSSVFPQLIKNKVNGETLRIWVAGCSTGEEVYSIAICLKEWLGKSSLSFGEGRGGAVQIFATDISEPAIAKARTGLYTKADVASLSAEHLKEFFTKANGGYQVNKDVREMCVFAVHNFLKDPPFGKMDFISCRNVLIYMETYLQKKALTTFHYALKPKGYLLLGKSETISSVPELFVSAVKHDKLFTRKDVPGKFIPTLTRTREQNFNAPGTSSTPVNRDETIRTDFQKSADEIMLRKYTPAGVVVNEAMDIVHFRGKTGNYLEQTTGKPSHNLLKMAKNGLAFELRNLLHKAKKDNVPVTRENIPMTSNGAVRNICIEAIPLPDMAEPHYLILFHDTETAHALSAHGSKVGSKKTTFAKAKKEDKDLRIEQLEKELAQLREDMRSITEDQEAVNEELQSANEELGSSSEELQSLNEELETGKEELQSTNEELTVVNQELISMNEQATEAREFSEAIIGNLHEPLLVLNKNLRVKLANRTFYETFQVNEAETEGKLIYDLGNKQWDIPALRNLLEKILPEKSTFTSFEVTHLFQSIGQRIMLLNAREIIRESPSEKLILLAIEDITENTEAEKIRLMQAKYKSLIENTPVAIGILRGRELIIESPNKTFLNFIGKDESITGKPLAEAMPELEGQPFLQILDDVYTSGKMFHAAEALGKAIRDGILTDGYYDITYQPLLDENGKVYAILNIMMDTTGQVMAAKKIAESETRYQNLIHASPNLISILRGKGHVIQIANDAIIEAWGKGKDVIGKPLLELIPEIIEQGLGDRLNEVYATGKPYDAYEMPVHLLRHGKWELSYYSFIYQAYRDTNGNIEGVAIIATDVTEQALLSKKFKEREEQFSTLADNISQLTWMTDDKGWIYWYNQRWYEYTGTTLDEMQGWGWQKVHHPDMVEGVTRRFKNAIDTGTDWEDTFMLRGKDGEYRWFLSRALPIRDEDGKILRWFGTNTDITEQIETEKRLSLMSTIVESSADAIISKTLDSIITSWNKGAEQIFGYTAKEVIGKHITILIPPELQQEEEMVISNIKKGKTVLHYETVRLTKDGRRINVSLTVSPVKDKEGKITGASKIARDITEQRNIQTQIEYRKALLEAHNEASIDGILLVDAKGKIISYNQRFIEIWNMPQHIVDAKDDEAALAFAMTQLVDPQQFIEKVKYLYDHPTETTTDILEYKDGKIVERHGYPVVGDDGSYYAWSWSFRDLTQEKQAERKIRESETRYHNLIFSSPSAIGILMGRDLVITTANQPIIDIWGKGNDVFGKKYFEMLPELAEQGYREVFDQVYTTGIAFNAVETPVHILQDGEMTLKYYNFILYPQRNINGEVEGIGIIATEVTSQAELNKRIKESEEEFRQLAELMPDKITTADEEGNTNYYNQNWFDYTGFTSEQLLKEGWAMLMHPDDQEEIKKRWHHSLETGNDFEMEFRILNKTGKYKWHLSRASAVKDKDGKITKWISTATEIHGQKEQRDKLEKAVLERTAELRQANNDLSNMNKELQSFAYISSHDLQEPLRKIQTFGSYIFEKEKQNLSSTGKDYFNRMQEAAKRMRLLIEDLLAYSRTNTADRIFEKIHLNKIVEEVETEFKETIDEKNAIIESGDMCEVSIIPFQFRQLFSNLIGNSLKFSMAGKPAHIIIKSKIGEGAAFGNELLSPQKQYCHINITDNGIGFDPQHKDRIFNLFQRLHGKDEYPGTGIGLAIVKKIVDNHNGFITASGEINKGARFDIYIPVE